VINQKTVYQKTLKGIAEIAATDKTLNFRLRRALILVDGKRSDVEIGVYLNQINMPEILADLEALGHIYNTANPSPPSLAVTPAPAPAQTQAPTPPPNTDHAVLMTEQQVNAVKSILISSTEQHLGIMGRGLKQKIESAGTDEQLIACTSQWHMAIRESKLGREIAGALMDEVQQLLRQTSS